MPIVHGLLLSVLLAFLAPALAVAGDSIPVGELGARAAALLPPQAQAVSATPEGARLAAPLQDLVGILSPAGLAIASVSPVEGSGQLTLTPRALRRADGTAQTIPATGTVRVAGQEARLDRGLLTERITTSGDGIRQDFLLTQRPAGEGNLALELALAGASAECVGCGDHSKPHPSHDLPATEAVGVSPHPDLPETATVAQTGERARLTLAWSGRALSYGQLHVTDADGQPLPARLSVADPTRLVLEVQDQGARYPLTIDPTFSDDDWVNIGFGPFAGTDRGVADLAVGEGVLYVGGGFLAAGDVLANHVAAWDGSAWSPLGSGVNGLVLALALDETGHLYAGGDFTHAGEIEVNHVARWDGHSWSPLGIGTDGFRVAALTLDGEGGLYVGGYFTQAGGIAANHVAHWDGQNWSPVGAGVSGDHCGWECVAALALDAAGRLYAGGSFTQAGSVAANRVARWNGKTWTALGAGVSGADCDEWDCVRALVLDAEGNLYVGGRFTHAGEQDAQHIARWNGRSWSALGEGRDTTVYSLALDSAGHLYAGDLFTIARWDGQTWQPLGLGVNYTAGVHALALDKTGQLYAGGVFTIIDNHSASNIARWDGAIWHTLGAGVTNGINALAADDAGNLYVGGSFTFTEEIAPRPNWRLARWDGATWSPLGMGVNQEVRTFVFDRAGNLYVGGWFTQAGGAPANYVARWDGKTWSSLGSGTNSGIWALILDEDGNLYAGGDFTEAGGVAANHVARWDGKTWSPLGTGVSGEDCGWGWECVRALALDDAGSLYAGGRFSHAGDTLVNRIARWDGKRWSPLGSGTNDMVNALALTAAGDLYVGGWFTQAGGVAANHIARWDGSDWSPLGGINSGVAALALDVAGNLYAGGWFTQAGEVTANRVARWDGTNWSAIGTGTNDEVSALALDETAGHLYVGGWFSAAGGRFASRVAQYNLTPASDQYRIALTANPSDGGTVSGGGSYPAGQKVTVIAKPKTGWDFLRWTEGGTQVSTKARYAFTVKADRQLVAQFAQETYRLTVTKTGRGRVVSTPAGINCGTDCQQDYRRGTRVTLNIAPAQGWILGGLNLASCGRAAPQANAAQVVLQFAMEDCDKTVTATFTRAP